MDDTCQLYTRMGCQLIHHRIGGASAGGLSGADFSVNADGMLCVRTGAPGAASMVINDEGYLEVRNG